jgi:prephenate dehydrogenase
VPESAVVIGAGLIGTSVALALRGRGTRVWLADRDPAAARLARDIGAGDVAPPAPAPLPGGPADIAVLAVPPAHVAAELAAAQARGLARCYTDVASVKELPLRDARELGCDLSTFVAGHPLAGRERSGPAAARADLFLGRPWVLCPAPESTDAAVAAATALAGACGAQVVRLSAADHDRYVALVSHVPQLMAAAMAAQLDGAPHDALALAGQGLRDVTRIAAGDPAMWTQIFTANAGAVAQIAAQAAEDLRAAAAVLATIAAGGDDAAGAAKELTALLERGGSGVAAIPGKRGGPAPDYAIVQVVIPDRPGELARLFEAAGAAGINIEDVGIEHSSGLPCGVAELSVRPAAAGPLTNALAACGWPVRR